MLDKQFLKYKIEKYKNKRIYKDQDAESKRQARKKNAEHAQQEADAIHSYLTGQDRHRRLRNKSYIEGPLEGMLELENRTNMLNMKKPQARKHKRFIRHPIIWRRMKRYASLRLLRLRRMFKRMNIRFNPGWGRRKRPSLEMDCDLRIGGDLIFFDPKRRGNKPRNKISQNGYTEMPGGLIIMWGFIGSHSNYHGTINFQATNGTAFQTACFSVVISGYESGGNNERWPPKITQFDKNQFKWYAGHDAYDWEQGMTWIAIGK
tara:strand:+ start:617 stop:1402 length:786 start_codon:yes stop_codon:yes gene_type:complete